jgi:hypothetical protein
MATICLVKHGKLKFAMFFVQKTRHCYYKYIHTRILIFFALFLLDSQQAFGNGFGHTRSCIILLVLLLL